MPRRKKPEVAEDPDQTGLDEEKGRASWHGLRPSLRFGGWTLGLVAVVFGAAWLLFQADEFLSSDARFTVAARGADARDASIIVTGIRNASPAAIRRVFDGDRGRSLMNMNPEERRLRLRTVDWVRDASVRRVWPDQIAVEIEERTPIAFLQVRVNGSGTSAEPFEYRPMLIDADGVVLEPKGAVPKDLPLLTGVNVKSDVEKRRTRVLLMMRLLEELAEYRSRIEEVDVSDPDNVRVAFLIGGQRIILVLGNEWFRERIKMFLDAYEGIKDRLMPGAVLDIGLTGRITQIPAEEVPKH